MNRTDADDFAGSARNVLSHSLALEDANRFASAEELAGEIHVQHELPLRKTHLVDGCVLLEPGIIDDNIQRAELIGRALEHGLDLILLRNVRFKSECFAPAATNLIGHLFGFLGS